jgi:hypothetical protein
MNERIRELAEQAGLVRNGDFGMKRWEGPRSDSISDQDLEKFAELIVAECMEVVAKKCASPTAYNALAEHWKVE